MTLKEILFGGGSALFVLLTLLQLAPIKINPWSAIAKAFGRAINSEVLEKVGKLESELQCVRSGMAEEKAVNCRARILRFGDECLHGERHTKDHFDQTQLPNHSTAFRASTEKSALFQSYPPKNPNRFPPSPPLLRRSQTGT